MRDLIIPAVSIHGSEASSLVGGVLTVIHALQDADEAFAKASPHARDYGDFNDWRLARDAWLDRRQAIAAMICELEEHAHSIASQDPRRIDTKESYL